uniref:Uncharacterized protein n=1 Tax=Oryza barthii TaxID=65489 RepID=A0A0D3ESN2_9ORYZ
MLPQPPSPSSFGVVATTLQALPPLSPSLSSFVVSSPDADPALEARGVEVCGTGAAVAIFSNKYPGIYATHCATAADAVNTRSINACNVLALPGMASGEARAKQRVVHHYTLPLGMATPPDVAAAITDAWLATPFHAPCPSSGDTPWPEDIQRFFDSAPAEMAAIPKGSVTSIPLPNSACAICCLRCPAARCGLCPAA